MDLKKSLKIIFMLTLFFQVSYAFDLDSLINSYDYTFENGVVNVVQTQDSLIDTNQNNLTDKLEFNIETNIFNSNLTNYTISVILDNKNYISEYVNLESTFSKIQIPTYLLNENQYNYTIEIKNQFNSVVFRMDNYQTQILDNYETGFNLYSTIDKLNLENEIQFDLEFSQIPEFENKQVTLFLEYNNQTLIYSKEVLFENPNQLISFNIPKENIFQTKHTGKFKLKSILVDNKRIYLDNYTTDSYSYIEFTNKSFITSQDYSLEDLDNNSLYEKLNINFNLNIVEQSNYEITFSLFDSNNNFVNTYSIQNELTNTNNILTHSFDGEEFYRTKINGPYTIKNIYLKQINQNLNTSEVIDVSKNEITTEQISYLQFEKPTLPELNTKLITTFDELTNQTQLIVIVNNNGTFPAFNFNLELFNSKEFSFSDNIMFLNTGESINYSFIFNNTNGSELYTSLIDSNNFVDELNEENNQNQIKGIEQIIDQSVCGLEKLPNKLIFIDSNCNPIINARVNLLKETGTYIKYLRTDSNGIVDFSNDISLNGNKFQIDHNGAKFTTEINSLFNGSIIQSKAYSLKVLDNNNEPIKNARINLLKETGTYIKYLRTNENGTVTFQVVPNANMKFQIDYNGAKYSMPVNNDNQIKINTKGYSLKVLDNNNGPISNARVNLLKESGTYIKYLRTDSNGIVTFQNVPNAKQQFQVDYNGAKYSMYVNNDTQITINTKAYSLKVLDNNNEPINNVRVNLLKESGTYIKYLRTDSNGIVTFQNVPNAKQQFQIDYNGAKYSMYVNNDTQITINTKAYSLKVLDNNNKPISNARVNLLKEAGTYIKYLRTDTNGIVTFQNVPNAKQKFQIDHNGAKYSIPVNNDTQITLNTLGYSLKVLDNNNEPINNVRVNLLKESGTYIKYLRTDSNGVVTFQNVPNAKQQFQIDHNGAKYSIPVNNNSQIIMNTKGYSLKVLDNNNEPINNVRVNLLKESGTYIKYLRTDSNGVVIFQNVPNAKQQFQIDHNGAKYSMPVNNDTQITINTKAYSLNLINSQNLPINNARVNLLKSSGTYIKYKKTNTNGTVIFQVVPNANHKFQLDYNGDKYTSQSVSNTEPISVQTFSFGGLFVDSSCTPTENVRFNLLKESGTYVKNLKTNGLGEGSFEVVPNANMKIQVDHNSLKETTQVYSINQNTNLNIQTSHNLGCYNNS